MFSYDPQGGTPADQIRTLLGDTDGTAPDLQDEEIALFVGMAGATPTGPMGAIFRAAALAATALLGRYAGQVTYSATTRGSLSFSNSDKFAHYQGVVASMNALLASAPVQLYAGGQSVSDKLGQELQTDRVRPFFTREMGDIPGSMSAADWEGTDEQGNAL